MASFVHEVSHMSYRAALALAMLASCYSPELADCVLPCASSADCANGQVCTAAKLCAGASTMTCSAGASPTDASPSPPPPPPPMRDAAEPVDAKPPRDASEPPDASPPPTTVPVTIMIMGTGNVALAGTTCMSIEADGVENPPCIVQVPEGKPATASAMPKNGTTFVSWTSQVCGGQKANCMFTPTGPTTIAAQFSSKKN